VPTQASIGWRGVLGCTREFAAWTAAPVIDLHSHVLPGLDDGARSIEDSLEILRVAEQDGVTVVAATPHVRADYPTTADAMERALNRLRRALSESGSRITVLPGGEIDATALVGLVPDERSRFGLAGNPSCLLVETPYRGWPLPFVEGLARLVDEGITPVLAHPERNDDVQREPQLVRRLVERGAVVQVTASSLTGALGRSSRVAARELLDLGLAHLVASDAHAPMLGRSSVGAARREIGDGRLWSWLTVDVPLALVMNRELPTRPNARKRRTLGRLL
jgi:protein-tyrosine phosphatase